MLTRRWRRAEAAKQTIDDCDAQTEVRKASIYARRSWLKATQASGTQCAGQHVAPGGGQPGHFSFTNDADTASEEVLALANTAVATETCATKHASKSKKILMKLWHARVTSMENLSTSVAATSGQLDGKVIGMSSFDNGLATSAGATTPATVTEIHVEPCSARPHQPSQSISDRSVRKASSEVEMEMKNLQNHSTLSDNNGCGGGGICGTVEATAAETKTLAQTETRALTMPLNCATTRKTILNATTTTTTSVLAQVNAVSKPYTTTPRPTPAAVTTDSNQPEGEEGEEKVEYEVVKEALNGKISPRQQHVQSHTQLSTWEQQQQQQQQRQLPTTIANNRTDSQSIEPPPVNAIAVQRGPSMQRSQSPSQSIFNDYKNNRQHENCNCPSSMLLYVDKRRPAIHMLNSATAYLNKLCRSAATATDGTLHTPAGKKQCRVDYVASSRKNSNSTDNSSGGRHSDITASAHSILTPASSLSSGVFSTSVDPSDLASSIEACRAPHADDAIEITAIASHKNALLSPADSLGQSSSISSSLRSLSSLASSLLSSTISENAPLPLMAAASAEAYPSTAALNSTFISSDQPSLTSTAFIPSSVVHSPSVETTFVRQQFDEAAYHAFRCPCDGCDAKFNGE